MRAFFLSRWASPHEAPEGPRPPTGPSGDEEGYFPSSQPVGHWPSFGHDAEGAGAPAAPHATPEGPSEMGEPELSSARSAGWFDHLDGVRASGSSTEAEVAESRAVTEVCDDYDEPVTLAYGFGAGEGQAPVEGTAPQAPTGGAVAASHVDLRPPRGQSPGSPPSRCSLDGTASPLAPWQVPPSMRSRVPLQVSAAGLSNALRPLAAGRAPPEAGCYISMAPDELDPRRNDGETTVAGRGIPPMVGCSSPGALTPRRRSGFTTPDDPGRSSPGRSSPLNSGGRFRLTRTRSSLALARNVAPIVAGAELPLGGGPTAGRPCPLRAPPVSVDLGAPLRGEGLERVHAKFDKGFLVMDKRWGISAEERERVG